MSWVYLTEDCDAVTSHMVSIASFGPLLQCALEVCCDRCSLASTARQRFSKAFTNAIENSCLSVLGLFFYGYGRNLKVYNTSTSIIINILLTEYIWPSSHWCFKSFYRSLNWLMKQRYNSVDNGCHGTGLPGTVPTTAVQLLRAGNYNQTSYSRQEITRPVIPGRKLPDQLLQAGNYNQTSYSRQVTTTRPVTPGR